ncbi:MAG: helix-hairpin-helix domain-containing protein [Peptostreptococcaceae bacterium]|nr:helix-hairpin-helix domain-containing protein [Peptostreptococcaceae bacterium]
MKVKIFEYIKYHKEYSVKILIIFCLVLFGLFICLGNDTSKEIVVEKNGVTAVTAEAVILTGAGIEDVNYIYVDISGAVNSPGVLKLEENMRVYQAIEMIGGLKADADVSGINMAAKLEDENKIYIPKVGEKLETAAINNLQSKTGIDHNGKININTANSQQLQELSGVGPSTADKIIQYREEHGSYQIIEDIKNVSGIGDKTFAKFKDNICI